jgi:DNA-3-methyladenine glycosylase II
VLDVATRAKATQHLARVDARLGKLIARVGPFSLTVAARFSPFEGLAHAIAHQQLTGKVALAILGRLTAAFPGRRFPLPEDIAGADDALLRGVGFSGAKVAALKDLAAKVLDGTVPQASALRKMSDEEIVERLTSVRGVGRWTAEMLLIFRLGRLDVLPVDDFGVRKGFSLVYRREPMATPRELAAFGERWRPYRSVASWYFWRALELPSATTRARASRSRPPRKG